MKVLIQNYNDILSTQTFYINQFLNEIDSLEVKIWNVGQASVHDALDSFNPDLLIASGKLVNEVLIRYLSENKKIKVIVNTTRCNQHIVDYIESKFTESGIDCPLFFSEGFDELIKGKPKNIKFLALMPALDLFLNPQPPLSYNIKNCIITNKRSETYDKVCNNNTEYHKMIFGVDLHSEFDIESNISNACALSDNYEELTLVGDVEFICSQIFFNALARAKKVSIKPHDSDDEKFQSILSKLFSEKEKEISLEKIKEQIEKEHTCIHRVFTLMNEAGYEDQAKLIVTKFGEQNGQ